MSDIEDKNLSEGVKDPENMDTGHVRPRTTATWAQNSRKKGDENSLRQALGLGDSGSDPTLLVDVPIASFNSFLSGEAKDGIDQFLNAKYKLNAYKNRMTFDDMKTIDNDSSWVKRVRGNEYKGKKGGSLFHCIAYNRIAHAIDKANDKWDTDHEKEGKRYYDSCAKCPTNGSQIK